MNKHSADLTQSDARPNTVRSTTTSYDLKGNYMHTVAVFNTAEPAGSMAICKSRSCGSTANIIIAL